jgi:hypothetical protein
MTKKDAINWALMAPWVLIVIGACLYAAVNLIGMQPLGIVVMAAITAFIIGFIRLMEI